jgi:hypothetical protein
VSVPDPGAVTDDAVLGGDAAGDCAKAGIASALANSAALKIETVRFISFSFFP